LYAYFDPASRQKSDMESGMAQFYAIQLQDANKTIQSLRDKNNQL